MPRKSRWDYDKVEVAYDRKPNNMTEARVGPRGSRIKLRVPSTVTVGGTIVVQDPEERMTPRAVGVSMELRLEMAGRADLPAMYTYLVREKRLMAVEDDEICQAWQAMGVTATFTLDKAVDTLVRWSDLQRRVLGENTIVIVDKDDEREVQLDDSELTDAERVAIMWYRAVVCEGDPNVLIAEHFGCSRDAAMQRLRTARKAGLVPPARHGQRKVMKP